MKKAGKVCMRLGIVSCEAIKGEMRALTEGDPDIVHTEYLDFGLHVNPENMKRVIIEKVNALEGKVDAVFLGYGICQSLSGITTQFKIPVAMLEVDDCIAALLTPSGYETERKKCAGTWYNTPFFSEAGMRRLMKEFRLDDPKFQKYDKMWFIKRLFSGYSRCLYINTGVGDVERQEAFSRAFAEELNLRHETTQGTVSILRDGLMRAKALANKSDRVNPCSVDP